LKNKIYLYMKVFNLTFLIILIHSYGFSQSNNDCDWEVTNTANNAVIAIQQDNSINYTIQVLTPSVGTNDYMQLQMTQFNCSATLGVFYSDDNGDLVCGGMTQWDNTQSMAIAAWGDDPTTPEKDGFSPNELYTFKLCVNGLEQELSCSLLDMSTDPPFLDYYSTNGFGSINEICFDAGFSLDFYEWALSQNCDGIEVDEYNSNKRVIKSLDLYGRNIISSNQKGLQVIIYNDLTIEKLHQF
tara:strand:- start:7724 stop:8449 length:726 start_codon:yes stop_codon:yes gene_type:complete